MNLEKKGIIYTLVTSLLLNETLDSAWWKSGAINNNVLAEELSVKW